MLKSSSAFPAIISNTTFPKKLHLAYVPTPPQPQQTYYPGLDFFPEPLRLYEKLVQILSKNVLQM